MQELTDVLETVFVCLPLLAALGRWVIQKARDRLRPRKPKAAAHVQPCAVLKVDLESGAMVLVVVMVLVGDGAAS